jgi:putative DNA primase/helicase
MSDPIVIDRSTPLKTAEQFRGRVHPNLIHHQDEFLTWNGSAYEARENATILSQISEFMSNAKSRVITKDPVTGSSANKFVPFHPKKSDVGEVDAALRNLCHVASDTMSPPTWLADAPEDLKAIPARNIVSCRNGLLDIETMKLHPQTPAFFTRYALAIDYDPSAFAPHWEQFLDEAMIGRSDLIDFLQEMLGYLITPDTSLQKAFHLHGLSGSGKGTFMRVATAVCGGDRNVASPTIKNLGSAFGLFGLIGKQVATVTEMTVSDKAALNTAAEVINSISGEDLQQIPRKYKDDWVGYLSTRFVLAGNNLPNFGDHANAMMRRLLVIPFEASFTDRADTRLSERLINGELAGILNWALVGLHRLRERGDFIEPEPSKLTKRKLLLKSNPLHGFIEECCTVEAGARVEKRVFYSRYERYCQDMRVPPKALQNITDDLEAMFPVKQVKPKAGGKRLRAYEGIRFSDEMLPRVYQVANADLADLGFGFEALRCDEHGWPIPRVMEADDFSV